MTGRYVPERPECQHVLFPATRVDPEERCNADDVAVGQDHCPAHGGETADTECAGCALPTIATEAYEIDAFGQAWCSEGCADAHNDALLSQVAS